jgi:hypothetical protein
MGLEWRSDKMAVIFKDAWKSHILQDFHFPQEFPQREASHGAVGVRNPEARFSSKMKLRARLTPKLLQSHEMT